MRGMGVKQTLERWQMKIAEWKTITSISILSCFIYLLLLQVVAILKEAYFDDFLISYNTDSRICRANGGKAFCPPVAPPLVQIKTKKRTRNEHNTNELL